MAKQRASALSEIEVKSHLFLVHDQLNYRDGLWAKPPRSIPNTPDECPHYSRIVSVGTASEWIIVDVRVRLTFLALMRRPAVDLRQGAAHEFGAL